MGMTEGQPTWPPPPELVKVYESEMNKVRGEPSVLEMASTVDSCFVYSKCMQYLGEVLGS